MSFGSETGRTRSGTKGFSGKAKKKSRRKKQEFHTHRGHLYEPEQLNPEHVRARTVLALDRLGHQVLSTEPGGYDLEAWMKGLNSLLDDFEEKIGSERVTDEFRRRRREALVPLAVPSASEDVDSEIRRLNVEDATLRAQLSDLEEEAGLKVVSLREQRDACARELKLEREKLAEIKKANDSRQFFSRLIRSGLSTEDAQKRIGELESKLKGLDDDIGKSKMGRSGGDEAPTTGSSASRVEAQERLEAIGKRLDELQAANQGKLQLAHEREIATGAIAEIILSMKIEGSANAGESQVP